MNSDEIRHQSCYFLLLFSGLQMICSLYYDWDLSSGRSPYQSKLSEKLFPTFKYGALSLFLNGLLYHCISEPLYNGNSGFPLNYVCILININQICSVVCFFYPLFKYNPKDGYTIFELLVYIPTLIFGILLNIYGWEKKKPNSITIPGSWVLSRRRDWGLAGVFLAASQLILIFWSSMKCFYDAEKIKSRYGSYFIPYASSLFMMVIGSLGYHVLALKISEGNLSCHDILKYIVLLFATIELIGLIIYVYACTCAKQTRIFYYHSLFFSLGMVISAFGNVYISWKKFEDDVSLCENLIEKNDNINNDLTRNLNI